MRHECGIVFVINSQPKQSLAQDNLLIGIPI